VPDGDERAAALARLVRDSLADPRLEDLAAIEDRAVDLLGLLFGAEGTTTAVARRREALVWIRRHLRDPSISVSSVAAAIGVSERHLARAFEETGVGVARTILEMRLDLAHRLLTGAGAPAVQDVGAYCGFVSSAHFGRVFRERFEVTPAEVRRAAARA
jgi:transcriptional regulator GlxA family with amidase domain